MHIVVCIKQVPVVSAMTFDLETKTLKREGVPLEVSSFDIRALLKAVELRERHGGEVTVLTMGPPQARKALEHCLALGADRAIHLMDAAFRGSDTLATARALAMAIRRLPHDLILCGRNSTDAETGQVGPEVAELLDIPQVTGVRQIEVDPAAALLRVERETDTGYETVETSLPALVTAAEDLAPERFPTRAEREQAKAKPIEEVKASDLASDFSLLGVDGSPTWVAGIESVETPREQRMIQEASLGASVDALVNTLLERGLFGRWTSASDGEDDVTAPPGRPDKAVWVVGEILSGEIRPVTLELLGKAVELAAEIEGLAAALLMGGRLEAHAQTLGAYGADTIYLAEDPSLIPYTTERHAAVLTQAIRELHPAAVLLPSTAYGRDLAPRVAARLQLGLTGDCIDLALDGDGRLLQYKPAFGGNIVAPILSKTSPAMATVRPGMLKKRRPEWSRQARVERIPVTAVGAGRTRVIAEHADPAAQSVELDTAEVVVGVGKGIEGPENLPVIQELARVLGAPLATTRDVTDEGWLPKQIQVGLTGRAIAPRLYFAIGIRGASEHVVGIRRAGLVVAINSDPKAKIFQAADYGLLGDYREVVPLLTQALAKAKASRSV